MLGEGCGARVWEGLGWSLGWGVKELIHKCYPGIGHWGADQWLLVKVRFGFGVSPWKTASTEPSVKVAD